jgi:hypothetical protein
VGIALLAHVEVSLHLSFGNLFQLAIEVFVYERERFFARDHVGLATAWSVR